MDQLLDLIFGEVPCTVDKLRGKADEDAIGVGELEVSELSSLMALGGIA